MPRRIRHPEEPESHERWLVSYADFITLLFAFFVTMYALSSVNEGKYRVLSDSLVQAFRSVPANTSGTRIAPRMGAAIVPLAATLRKASSGPQEKRRALRLHHFSQPLMLCYMNCFVSSLSRLRCKVPDS